MKITNENSVDHIFNYEWTLKDANFTKDKGTVFSCFACGGGSTMGYKLAGFDVIGMNEIDPKMAESYIENHNPKYSYIEDVRVFKDRKNLPKELYNLDILDGSPPCSSFSMAGNREKDWGKEKKFREGQSKQTLDDLFFDFIDLAKELQPKVVVAENVSGLLMGNAKEYVIKIYKEYDEAGYYCQHWLLDASKMGVPQRRKRVFFVCLRKDLAKEFLHFKDMFTEVPKLDLCFDEKLIPFKNIEDKNDTKENATEKIKALWVKTPPGKSLSYAHPKGSYFNEIKVHKDEVCPTIRTKDFPYHYKIPRKINDLEGKRIGTYPLDYNFCKNSPKYLIGMSVPPVMTAQIATKIYKQWLINII